VGEPTGRHLFCSKQAQFGNNAPSSDNHRPGTLRKIQKKCAVARHFGARFGLLLSIGAALAGCQEATEPESAPAAIEQEPAFKCGHDGELRGDLYGALTAHIEWTASALECDGMPRPDGHGARLRFAGNMAADARRIAVIIAIPDLDRDAIGDEFRSNVTLIAEDSARFFSTPNLDNCLTDITALLPLDDDGDRFSIGGMLYCVNPLPEVNGDSSVSIPELHFSGLIDWSSS